MASGRFELKATVCSMDVMAENDKESGRKAGESDVHRQKRGKNIAVALSIFGFCVIVYLVSIVKMSGGAG